MYFYKKQYIFCIIFFISSLSLVAQEFIYFNKTYWGDTLNIHSRALEQVDDGYLIFGSYASINENVLLYVRKIDREGNHLFLKKLILENNGIGGLFSGSYSIVTNDRNILLCIAFPEHADSLSDIHFMKINSEGNILWHKIHKNNFINGVYEIIQTEDKGFAVVGIQRTSMQEPGVGYFLKTDSLANIEWEKTYYLDGHTGITSIEQVHDSGFIISGAGYQLGTEFDMFVLKTDSLGNEEWRRTYGGEEDEGYSYIKLLTSKNQYEQTGKMEYLLIGEDEPIQSDDDLYIAKLDDRGIVLWENRYDDFAGLNYPYPFFETMPIIKNGGFKIVANYRSIKDTRVPVLMDFNRYGQVNWQKTMSIDTSANVYIKDLQATPDGGYIMAGFKFSPAPQQSWIVKVDADGNTCWIADCDSTVVFTDIEEPSVSSNSISLSLFPNPASEQVEVVYQLPKNQEGILKVYDYQGKLVVNYQLLMVNGGLTLEVGDWVSGVYLYSLEIEGERLESGKLIVEK
ncbi:MAG: T9SS type A sorting domain-containing protein [Chitinophagales bacterium]